MRTRRQEIQRFAVFALLPLSIFILVLVVPFGQGVYYTFTDWNGFDVTTWVGLDNYVATFQNQDFWSSMLFTTGYVVATLILVNVVAFALALLVTIPLRGVNALRTAFFMPNLIGGVILGLIWQFLFGQALPTLAEATGIPIFAENWLLDTTTAFWAMVIVTVWQMSGYMMIIYVTALMSIEQEALEASLIDGTNSVQRMFYIKMPLMAQAFTISLFLTLRNAFMAFDLNLSLTGGNPYGTTELISLQVFREAFSYGNFASGQTQAVLMFVVIAIAALAQVAVSKRFEVQR
ncbi:MAG: sn-glycerol-3-phosphate transport system permease protein U [Actinomycetota bacterium]|jgi:raffinose/stachyose/melibiose transport system permease protein